jgi:hypothetical protein
MRTIQTIGADGSPYALTGNLGLSGLGNGSEKRVQRFRIASSEMLSSNTGVRANIASR